MRIIIIGAGLPGITSAGLLAQAGHEVIVLDRREGPALETSFANGGMLTPSQAAPWNSPGILWQVLKWSGREESPFLLKPSQLPALIGWGSAFLRHSRADRYLANQILNASLARYSLEVLRALRRDHDLHYDESTRGTMKIYRTLASLEVAVQGLRVPGMEQIAYQLLDRRQVVALEPALEQVSATLAGGLYFPDDEAGDAHLFCRGMARLAGQAGASFVYNAGVDALIASGDRIRCVRTRDGELEADLYILAAGAYSPVLARGLGLHLPIYPVKGYSLTIDTTACRGAVPGLPIIDELRHVAVTPLGARLRVAGKAELAGYDTAIDSRRTDLLLKFFRQIYPQAGAGIDANATQPWAGLRPYTCDGVPIIGPCRVENLLLNTGHGHLGWTFAAGSARLLADHIAGNATALDLTPYLLSRFN